MSGQGDQKILAAAQQAELLAHQGRAADGLSIVETALADQVDHPVLLRTRGWLLVKLDRDAEAILDLEQVLGAVPDDLSTRLLLAHALGRLGKYEAAEEAIQICLAASPDDSQFHAHYADILTIGMGAGRRVPRQRRKLAKQHLETALALDPENAELLHTAALIHWRLGDAQEAMLFVDEALAFEPDSTSLLALRADLTTALAVPTNRFDQITQAATEIAQTSKVLAHSPQHVEARRTLFHRLWLERMLLIDAPLSLLPILAIGAGAAFRSSGRFFPLGIAAGIVLGFGLLRAASYALTTIRATPGFRRLLFQEIPGSRLTRALLGASWALMLVSAVSLFFIRDAVAVRWMLVALGLAALAAFGASLSWQLRFHSAAERVGGFSDDVDSMSRLRGQRGSLSARIVFRAIGVLVISLFTLTIGGGGREDAIAVVWLGCGGLLLAPAIGVFALHLSERRSLAALPEQTTFPQSYRPPGPIGTATISIVAILALSLTALGALQLPVLPNGHDADENYTLEMSSGTPSASSSGSDEERCGGRPATRLACLTRKQRERAEQGWGVDVKPIEVPKIDIPEIDSDYSFDLDGDGTAE